MSTLGAQPPAWHQGGRKHVPDGSASAFTKSARTCEVCILEAVVPRRVPPCGAVSASLDFAWDWAGGTSFSQAGPRPGLSSLLC